MSRLKAPRSVIPFGKLGEDRSRGVQESGPRSSALRSWVKKDALEEARGVGRRRRGSWKSLRTPKAFESRTGDFRSFIDRAPEPRQGGPRITEVKQWSTKYEALKGQSRCFAMRRHQGSSELGTNSRGISSKARARRQTARVDQNSRSEPRAREDVTPQNSGGAPRTLKTAKGGLTTRR